VGNFTGEADYLYQRELVAGNPKVYGQLVQILAPYTRVLKENEGGNTGAVAVAAAALASDAATQAFVEAAAAPAPAPRKTVRIRKSDVTPDDAAPF
jgi:myo-inositol-1(or 4)-monophosphatase